MNEENKDLKKPDEKKEPPKEVKKEEQPKISEEAKKIEPEKKEEAQAPKEKSEAEAPKQKEAPVKKEQPKECSTCSKDIQKKWYYRENNYYCAKGCWKKSKKEKDKAGEKTEEKK